MISNCIFFGGEAFLAGGTGIGTIPSHLGLGGVFLLGGGGA